MKERKGTIIKSSSAQEEDSMDKTTINKKDENFEKEINGPMDK